MRCLRCSIFLFLFYFFFFLQHANLIGPSLQKKIETAKMQGHGQGSPPKYEVLFWSIEILPPLWPTSYISERRTNFAIVNVLEGTTWNFCHNEWHGQKLWDYHEHRNTLLVRLKWCSLVIVKHTYQKYLVI
jgi:hypothetical protein